jgi:transcriptional regulator with GAF, ATPase, and Fis domain
MHTPKHQKAQDMRLLSAYTLSRKLISSLSKASSRNIFLQTLSNLLRQHFEHDRLCINLYDPDSELLSYFTAAEGTIVRSLSPIRRAEKSTVAGHVIESRKPVVITDISEHFSESMLHPMAEAGLTTTMAFPLILDDKILGTMHCSFREKPNNLYEIMEMLLDLSPYVAAGLGALLALEQLKKGSEIEHVQITNEAATRETFFFESPVMRQLMAKVHAVAKLDIPILILGETGTGKSRLAHYIHTHSQRQEKQFVKVNCPAMASTLFESELFGHAKGAFTGAASKRVGRFELAHQGTLFLDEIAELNTEMQSKLLHVLEDRSFERVGESVSFSVDVRIIAATNVNINKAISSNRLRSDLYYRLSSFVIEIPPLRERIEDIPALSTFFMSQLANQYSLSHFTLSKGIVDKLCTHSWPGNARELYNVINSLLIKNSIAGTISEHDVDEALDTEDLGYERMSGTIKKKNEESQPDQVDSQRKAMGSVSESKTLEEIEKEHIFHALNRTNGVISGPKGAAKILGMSRSTLQRRIKKFELSNFLKE